MTRPVLYIAGPYTAGDTALNVHVAVDIATYLMDNDLAWPLVPHLSHMWHLISPRPYADWIALDFALLERCDGLIRLPGESPGADRELEHFVELGGRPVYCPSFSAVTHVAPEIAGWIGRQFGGFA